MAVRVVENMYLVILVISVRLKELGMSSMGLKSGVFYSKTDPDSLVENLV